MSSPADTRTRWYHSVWFVLLTLFVVAGPLGLPLLWSSPRFPRWAKWALTLAMIAYTWWLVVLLLRSVNVAFQHFNQLNSAFP